MFNSSTKETISDFLRCEQIVDKTEAGTAYHLQPSFLAILDSRTDTGKALIDARDKGIKVEICWFFSLTKEKYRIKCNINIWDGS